MRVSYVDKFGKQRTASKSGFKTKRQAQEYGTTLEYNYTHGGDLNNRNVDFIPYLIKWYQTFREPQLADATKSKYEYTIQVATNYFGKMKLKDINTTTYQKFLNLYGNGDGTTDHPAHAKATAEKINTHIRACVRNAINDGIIHHDFTANTHLVYDPSHTRGIHYLNVEQTSKLIKYLKGHLETGSIVNYMILTTLMTGMRASEVAALTWDSLDRKHLTLNINKSWDFIKKDFKATKNRTSNRVIDINHDLVDLLTKLQFSQNMYLNTHHQENSKNLMFITDRGSIPDYGTLNAQLKKALQRAGIEAELTFHGLRHTHASILLFKGVPIAYISQRLGHENISTTTRIYLHIIKELENKESEKTTDYMDQLLNIN
ncbi:integrase [Lentilactobacillus diolivorans DSM 14421]|uniref:Integrase n=1 Tax=Lentilactobacillus diolivorans DSM 14421 TaxID=1423739 RepID=A0A0R1S3D1_9LACO|nr:integrase [Lentilactobacillus diolivorans DSM 14421]